MIYFEKEELQKMKKSVLMRLATYFEIPFTPRTSKNKLVADIYKLYGIKPKPVAEDVAEMAKELGVSVRVLRAQGLEV